MPRTRKGLSLTARAASRRLEALSSPKRAKASAWFFKTGPGDYGEGDRFLGVTVPALRREIGTFRDLEMSELEKLLGSRWHEERLLALLILVHRYERADPAERERIFRFYLAHAGRINNWDLVDLSAPGVVGEHLVDRSRAVLARLARSKVLWQRRIAIVSTFAFLRRGQLAPTFALARRLMRDPHELIHKATGWALREAGKKDPGALRSFLAQHSRSMPRTMLRYAIERFPERERRAWLTATHESLRYRVGRSRIQGHGVFATVRIRKGTRIVEYTGDIVDAEEALRRAENREIVLLFDLRDGTFIDGDSRAPGPRVNHSCDPNCFTDQVGRRVFIVAARTIEPGEELTYDYLIIPGITRACFCGAANCRGTLNRAPRPKRRGRARRSAPRRR